MVGLLALLFYVAGVMATQLFASAFPDWFGTLPRSVYTLFQVMTLESWSMGIVRPVMQVYPYAWLFFIPFIIGTTFTILNLFIGIIVNAMQTEHAKEEAAERAAERDMMHEETEPLLAEIKGLRAEVAALRAAIGGRGP